MLGEAELAVYLQQVTEGTPATSPTQTPVRVVYTAMHGVGGESVCRVLQAAGLRSILSRSSINPMVGFRRLISRTQRRTARSTSRWRWLNGSAQTSCSPTTPARIGWRSQSLTLGDGACSTATRSGFYSVITACAPTAMSPPWWLPRSCRRKP